MELSLLPSEKTIFDYEDTQPIAIDSTRNQKLINHLESIFAVGRSDTDTDTDTNTDLHLHLHLDPDALYGNAKSSSQQVKDLIFYAREEVAVVADLMARLATNSLKPCRLSPLNLNPNNNPNDNLNDNLNLNPNLNLNLVNHAKTIKMDDIKLSIQAFGNALARLHRLLVHDQVFFHDIALALLDRNWSLQERPAYLYIDYGFKTIGSARVGEASILRRPWSSSPSAVEILTGYNHLFHTSITMSKNGESPVVWNRDLANLPSDLVRPLVHARSSVFEQELYHILSKEIDDDLEKSKRCVISRNSLVLPFRKGLFISEYTKTLADPVPNPSPDLPDKMDIDGNVPQNNTGNCDLFSYSLLNQTLAILSRHLLLKSYSSPEKPEILNRLLDHISNYECGKMVHDCMYKLFKAFKRSFPVSLKYSENPAEWRLEAVMSMQNTLELTISVQNGKAILFSNSARISFVVLMESLLDKIVSELNAVLWQHCILFFKSVSRIDVVTVKICHNNKASLVSLMKQNQDIHFTVSFPDGSEITEQFMTSPNFLLGMVKALARILDL